MNTLKMTHTPISLPAKILREIARVFHPRKGPSRAERAYLKTLEGHYKGQRCFIIGNGPSLTTDDLNRLKGEITFASNKIFLAYEETDWRPTFYTAEDALVIQNSKAAIDALTGSIKLMPIQIMHLCDNGPDTHPFAIIKPKNWDTPLIDPEFPAFGDSFRTGIAWGSTVVYTQIQLAVAMGFSRICILGLDHSYKEGRRVRDGILVSDGERNHFHPDYRPKGEEWHSPNLDVLEISYARARKETERRGVQILNCSRHSALHIFERAHLEDELDKDTLPR